MNSRLLAVVAAAGMVLPLGCGGEAAPELSSDSQELLYQYQGNFAFLAWQFIGRELNGTDANGKVLDGRQVTGVSFSGARYGGELLKSTSLQGSALVGNRFRGQSLKGAAIVGTTFTGTLDDGHPVTLRIDAASLSTAEGQGDVMLYAVSYPTLSGWMPMCGLDEAGQPIRAVALAGRWDYRQGVAGGGSHIDDASSFTFACQGFVLAKCVDMGYAPWREGKLCPVEGKNKECLKSYSMAGHHQACTRMIRADFCGDGTSYTADGTIINAYDGIGVRVDSETWAFEAEWNADGAVCAAGLRVPEMMPGCWSRLQKAGCGTLDNFDPMGTLLMTEHP